MVYRRKMLNIIRSQFDLFSTILRIDWLLRKKKSWDAPEKRLFVGNLRLGSFLRLQHFFAQQHRSVEAAKAGLRVPHSYRGTGAVVPLLVGGAGARGLFGKPPAFCHILHGAHVGQPLHVKVVVLAAHQLAVHGVTFRVSEQKNILVWRIKKNRVCCDAMRLQVRISWVSGLSFNLHFFKKHLWQKSFHLIFHNIYFFS